jgi:hypothetical protein
LGKSRQRPGTILCGSGAAAVLRFFEYNHEADIPLPGNRESKTLEMELHAVESDEAITQ